VITGKGGSTGKSGGSQGSNVLGGQEMFKGWNPTVQGKK
jgi:hypothetical protein